MLYYGHLNAAIGLELNDHLTREIWKAANSNKTRRNGFSPAEFVTEHKIECRMFFLEKRLPRNAHRAISNNQGAISAGLCLDQTVGVGGDIKKLWDVSLVHQSN